MRSLVLSPISPDQDIIIPNLTAVSASPRNITFNKSGIIGILYLTMLHFTMLHRYCIFYKLKICGSPSLSKSIGTVFPVAFAHLVSVCHSLFILAILPTFNQQHMKTHWRLRWWLSSVQFSHSVVSDSLWRHGLQHTRPPCPSATPGVYSNSCPLSQWCHPTILPSVVLFSFCLHSFPEAGSFQMSQLFASSGQSIGVSASASVLPMNTQDSSLLGWTGWISCSPRDSQESPLTPQFKSTNSSSLSFLYSPTLTSIHDYWKSHSFD